MNSQSEQFEQSVKQFLVDARKDVPNGVRVVLEFASVGQATPDSRIDDLGLDSLDFLQLMVDLEQEFDVRLEAEEFAKCETVGDIIALIQSKC